jgi:class 3 adenylate cyclase
MLGSRSLSLWGPPDGARPSDTAFRHYPGRANRGKVHDFEAIAQKSVKNRRMIRSLLSRYHEHVRHDLERFGGTVEKFIGGAAMTLFGAPVAHEDDPERAVRAALAIRDWARDESDVQVRGGVMTGEALVTLGTRPELGEGMASGDVVNTGAGLEAAAPVNGILVGEATYRATSGLSSTER